MFNVSFRPCKTVVRIWQYWSAATIIIVSGEVGFSCSHVAMIVWFHARVAQQIEQLAGILTQALPFELTLAAIRKFIWQRDSDIEIRFRIMDPQHPAPMPDIRPP